MKEGNHGRKEGSQGKKERRKEGSQGGQNELKKRLTTNTFVEDDKRGK